jgi:hypothetical protein
MHPIARHETYLPTARFRSGGGGYWMAHLAMSSETTVEIIVGGTEVGPDVTCVTHLNALLPMLEDLVRRASTYLDAFVDRERLSPGETWWLDGIRIECDEAGKP